ncbi:RNA polymerase sigma factor SigF [Nocardia asteroides]|uniref:RNA polymerase sigma factor SigF n=1 Tax=Nocardia asteroides NBRC 15531 TaxID=1110697 RepID=U5E4F8_NOCAS|nr:RNA polymerase sigma factor SigF [Nocardia asteroides]TLF64305.1 RNA polymerase sigma factor SigF [Nocardia asteroides NBRC 15531]GAD84137.1 RNA polymerase sigma factor SigF [Nocardia asteroides NBRC 15531]SFN33417.1 RNA polymerase sigma-B factor [Nocardia asteroides]VEG36594.1 Sigma-37 [Nocardia asteroides]
MHGEDTTEDHKPDQDTAQPDAHATEPDQPEDTDSDDDTEATASVSGYDDVSALFERLAATVPGSVEHVIARDALINRCIPLADHIARKFSGRGEPFDDLSQVARVGLVHAVDRFDLSRGSNFLSFAVPTIMGEVRRYFRDNTWAMRVPRRVKETHLRIGAAVDQLSQRLGRSPTAKEIAAELDVDPDEVTQAVIAGNAYQPTSIDAASVGRDSDASLLDTLGEEEAQFDRVEEYIAVRPLLAGLPERERRILTMRFFESMTQTQIAAQLGISQMHVSRILAKTLARLRELSERD